MTPIPTGPLQDSRHPGFGTSRVSWVLGTTRVIVAFSSDQPAFWTAGHYLIASRPVSGSAPVWRDIFWQGFLGIRYLEFSVTDLGEDSNSVRLQLAADRNPNIVPGVWAATLGNWQWSAAAVTLNPQPGGAAGDVTIRRFPEWMDVLQSYPLITVLDKL